MIRRLAVLTLALALPACGSDSPSTPTPTPTPTPPPPSASVTASGGGAIVIYPSALPAFFVALSTPIRIQETAGGTADWNFARMSLFRGGRETERYELTATDIRNAGYNRIAANSNQVYTTLFRFNEDDFDDLQLTLGFNDARDGRSFTITVDLDTFTDVLYSPTPRVAP